MARPKAPQSSSVEKTITDKLASIEAQIIALQTELKHWQKVASDYETNKVTIESILSVHQAPDLSAPVKKTRAKNVSKPVDVKSTSK